MKIDTVFVNPPIGDRNCDWQATMDDYEPGCPIGRGRTESEAIEDLMEQMGEKTCPHCGSEEYDTYWTSPAVGDPSTKYCVCTHCEKEFPHRG